MFQDKDDMFDNNLDTEKQTGYVQFSSNIPLGRSNFPNQILGLSNFLDMLDKYSICPRSDE